MRKNKSKLVRMHEYFISFHKKKGLISYPIIKLNALYQVLYLAVHNRKMNKEYNI